MLRPFHLRRRCCLKSSLICREVLDTPHGLMAVCVLRWGRQVWKRTIFRGFELVRKRALRLGGERLQSGCFERRSCPFARATRVPGAVLGLGDAAPY